MTEPVRVPLTQGKYALVSPEDAERVLKYKWFAVRSRNGVWYARRSVYLGSGKQSPLPMHRFILDAPNGLQVDHINDNGLDNRRENLRVCTPSQNHINSRYTKNKNGYRGVRLHKVRGKPLTAKPYQAMIRLKDRLLSLGYHATPEEAARAYDEAAIEHFGEFARLNFPEQEAA